MRPLILGTAGHIDHGKTALIRALTGIDADRLPEEKRRGLTIDLGFAHLEIAGRDIGIVDVPGHERFIRNMAAGATGIDLVMLVVAADDGVMPQTREHLEIVDLLGVAGGLVALTKIDVADEERISRAEAGVRALTEGTPLARCPVVRVSSATGEGIPLLREAIAERIEALTFPPWPPLFRMPVDRVFTLQGHGVIVTGSLMGGDVAAGDEVELLPRGRRLRVRSVQSHGAERGAGAASRRAAVNLPGTKRRHLQRGDELAAPGFLRPTRRFAARVRCLPAAPDLLEPDRLYRLHIGTNNVDARLMLIDAEAVEPGAEGLAIVRTEEEVCAAWGQRFILRAAAHGVTLGGGAAIFTQPPRVKRREGAPSWLRALESSVPRERILAALQIEPTLGGAVRAIHRETGVEPGMAEAILSELAAEGRIVRTPGEKGAGYWTRDYLEQCKTELLRRLREALERARPRLRLDRGEALKAAAALGGPDFIDWLLGELETEGRIERAGQQVHPADYEVRLDETERRRLQRLLAVYEKAGFSPPSVEEALRAAGLGEARGRPLYAHAVDAGELVEFSGEFALHRNAHERLIATLRRELNNGGGLTVSRIRELIGTTRKWAVPLCEYLDRRGYTRRDGDLRFAGERLKNVK